MIESRLSKVTSWIVRPAPTLRVNLSLLLL
jgi:hypothetical protein